MAGKIDHDDLITCPICFEQFTSPKRLPCLHTFCHPCLKSYIVTHLGGEGKRGQDFPCPVCRQVVGIVDSTLSLEKIADTLPDNQLIASLIEKSKGSGKKQKEQLCGPCSRENKDLAATQWCKICLEALCKECTTFHKRFDPTRHKTIAVEEMTEKSTVLLDVDEPCMEHTAEFLKVYCVDHKEMCCIICLATLHRKCEHVSTFDEMVNDSKDVEMFEDFNNKLSEMDKKSHELKIQTEKNISDLNGRQEEISKNVSSTIQKAKDKLDQLQTKFDHDFQQKHKDETMKLTERVDKIEIFQNNVKKGQKLLHAVREHGTPKQLFVTQEKLKQQLKSHLKTLGEDLQDVKRIDYTLKIDDVVMSVAQCVDSVAMTEIKQTSDLTQHLMDIVDVVKELNGEKLKNAQPEPFDIMQLEVRKVDETDVKKHFPGGTYLTDDHKPVDVCCLSDKEILVSFDFQNYIKKYEVTKNEFLEKGTIRCKKGPFRLAATNDRIIVGSEEEVDILYLDGSFEKVLSERTGGRLSYVNVSMPGNILYTSGDKSERVCVFSPDGTRMKILIKNITNPYKIELNPQGTVSVKHHRTDIIMSPSVKIKQTPLMLLHPGIRIHFVIY
ncbi:hypothetical protein KUTeg_017559 [Tegillarca granosa]|uniref:Uncharacterized protein n=1 Tax=Tegillarca granosa TaxID=220873 RepID=A0ABQ9EHS5_TEGGR|nr:hypothetical protein KUTeg_017559 [Tegillarca granosa]